MSGFFADIDTERADDSRVSIAEGWHRIARSLPAVTLEDATGRFGFYAAAVHDSTPAAGIARTPDGAFVLVIAGQYWMDDDSRLATPPEALATLVRGVADGGPALHGQYTFAFHDIEARRVIAESGGLGVIRLYYSALGQRITLGTDLKFFLAVSGQQLNPEAAEELLVYGHLSSGATLLAGIDLLPPASRLVWSEGQTRLRQWRLPPFSRTEPVTETMLDALDEQFERGLTRSVRPSGRVCVSLSGGLDSRIALTAARKIGLDVEAWTAGEPGSLECSVARQVAQRLGIPIRVHANDGRRLPTWFERAVWLTEGKCAAGHMHFLDAAFSGIFDDRPQLHGLIGDVVAGGDYDTAEQVPRAPDDLHRFCRRFMEPIVYWPEGTWERLELPQWASPSTTTERVTAAVLERTAGEDPYSTFLWSRYLFRGVGFIFPTLVSQVAPWSEMVAPFIDPAFFASCSRIGRPAILDRRMQLQWALRRYPEIAQVPRVKDGALLDLARPVSGDYEIRVARLRSRVRLRYYITRLTAGRINPQHRESYPYYAQWYRRFANVRTFVDDTLLSRQSLERGLWSRPGVERLLNDLRVGRNVWDAVGTILTLEFFHRLFIDRSGANP